MVVEEHGLVPQGPACQERRGGEHCVLSSGFAVGTEQIAIPVCAAATAVRNCFCMDRFVWTQRSYVEALGWSSSRLEPGVYLALHWLWL